MAEAERVDRQAIEHGYEPSDVWPWGVVLVGAGLTIVLIVVGLSMWWLLTTYRQDLPSGYAPPTPVERTELIPPAPRLQTDPKRHADAEKARAAALLRSYGWVDRDAGIARIPIDQAMRLLARQGWPSGAWRTQ